eukprot:1923091-Amphidinium_carterae.1
MEEELHVRRLSYVVKITLRRSRGAGVAFQSSVICRFSTHGCRTMVCQVLFIPALITGSFFLINTTALFYRSTMTVPFRCELCT